MTPDWLEDVGKSESLRPSDPQNAPDWLEDVQQQEQAYRSPADIALDWLEDIRQIEESLRVRHMKTRYGIETPAEGIRPTKAEAPSHHQGKGHLPDKGATAGQPCAESPRRASLPSLFLAPLPEAPPVAPLGFDPITGQILDPAAFKNWQKAEAQRRQDELQNQPTLSVAEVFLEAQRALQEWVDCRGQQAPGGRRWAGDDPELSLGPGHPAPLRELRSCHAGKVAQTPGLPRGQPPEVHAGIRYSRVVSHPAFMLFVAGVIHALHRRDQPNQPDLLPVPGGPVVVHAGGVRGQPGEEQGPGRGRCHQPPAAKPGHQVRQVAKASATIFTSASSATAARRHRPSAAPWPVTRLAPISEIAKNPLRVEQRTRKVDDGAGGIMEQKFKFPVWFEPVAQGKTPDVPGPPTGPRHT